MKKNYLTTHDWMVLFGRMAIGQPLEYDWVDLVPEYEDSLNICCI